ncbi:phosphatases II [Xylariaceae sp. FL1272]|nr:phosphatases II [Xylariaceae sp. FL1272]
MDSDGSESAHGNAFKPPTGTRMAIPNTPYAQRPPSPPAVELISPFGKFSAIKHTPTYDNVDPKFLSREEWAFLTRDGHELRAFDCVGTWTYQDRHKAQEIVDGMYLGSSRTARDRQWLQETGITMLIAARDSQQASANIMDVSKVAQALRIEAAYVDVSGYQELIASFPATMRKINAHKLRFHQNQIANAEKRGQREIDPTCLPRAKILIFCETGNERSAIVVAAYLMAVYGMCAQIACSFVVQNRFCASLPDESKQMLLAYEQVLKAQRHVNHYELAAAQQGTNINRSVIVKKSKRGIDETVDGEQDTDMDGDSGTSGAEELDRDRFLDRPAFVPFRDN